MFESQTRLTEHAQLTQHTATERKCIKSTANNVKRRQRQQQQQQLVKKSAVQWTVIQFRSTDYACDSVCVWEREHCIWYSVHFRLLNLSNNCKVLGQLSSAFSFSCSLVSFRFVSLFIYSFRLPQSHVSRLLLFAVFVVSNAAWKASSFWGPKCDKRRNKQTSDEIEFIANGFNAGFRAINKYETKIR